jgi:translation initiation factor IF-2
MDFSGKMLNDAGPATPVQILGLESVPSPGDILNVVKNEREAQKIVDNRINERKALSNTTAEKKTASLEDFFATAQNNSEIEKKILKLIVRSDVQGSFEAIKNAVQGLGNSEVSVEVIGGGVGAITDNDVNLAASSQGYIMGFNMRPVTTARRIAEEKGVDIKTYSIIYELINDVTLALEGMLTPERVEKYIGRAQVKETFSIPKVGTIAGTSVIDGKIERGCNIRLLRDGKILYDGRLSTLKRFKDEVKEVKNGYECGMALENFNDIKSDDLIEAYIMEEKKRTLTSEATL